LSKREKVFVLGLDGVSYGVLERVARGMPFTRRVMRYGVRSVMVSTTPPWTPPAWTSIFTGVNPGKHGVYSFQKVVKGGRGFVVRPYHYGDVGVPFLHEALGFWGRKVVAVNVPLTYPARPRRVARGNALVVSDWSGPEVVSNATLPESIMLSLRRTLQKPVTGRDDAAKRVIREYASSFTLAVKELMERVDWDVFIVVYPFTDWVMHDNPSFFSDGGLSDLDLAPFIWADVLLEGASEYAGKLIVVSDHGFTRCPSIVNVPYHLIKAGFSNPLMRGAVSVGRFSLSPKLASLARCLGPVRRLLREAVLRLGGGERVVPYSNYGVIVPDTGVVYAAPGNEERVKAVLEGIDGVKVVDGKDVYWGKAVGTAPDYVVDTTPSFCVGNGDDAPCREDGTSHSPHGVFMFYGDAAGVNYPSFMRAWDAGNALFVEAGIPPPSYGDVSSLRLDGVLRFNYSF